VFNSGPETRPHYFPPDSNNFMTSMHYPIISIFCLRYLTEAESVVELLYRNKHLPSPLFSSVFEVYMDYYRGADKSLARPTSLCILFDGENISFDASLVIYINSANIPPIMIVNRIYETQNLLSL
jgi:hypothetical protein